MNRKIKLYIEKRLKIETGASEYECGYRAALLGVLNTLSEIEQQQAGPWTKEEVAALIHSTEAVTIKAAKAKGEDEL